MTRRIGRTVALVLLVLGVLGPRPADADEEVARFLLDQAKRAISARKFDEAVVKLERALEEDATLLEAAYVLGQVHEKKKEKGLALGAYRRFRDGCVAEGDALDKKLARLLSRAEKRIAVLGKGEKELLTLQASFGERILRLARRLQASDPDLAIDALRRLVAVAPGNAAAKQLLGDLTGEGGPSADGGPSPIPGITAWDDLLGERAIPPGKDIQYKRKLLTIDQQGGTIFWTDPTKRAPETYVLDLEFRFLREYAVGYLVGFAFAQDEDVARSGGQEFVLAMAQKSSVVLAQASGGRNIDLAEHAVSAKPLETWRRLTVAVEGRKVRVYLDGEKELNATIPGRRDLKGPIGIFHQRSAVEIRTLRLGTKE